MTCVWYQIAKYEFLVLTSRFRFRRLLVSLVLFCIGVIWALVLAPLVFLIINNWTQGNFDLYVMGRLPGLLRLLFLNLWLIMVLSPLTYALEEIKIGQWEIMLSNNVKTRDIMLGTFVSRLPIHGLTVLFLTPVFVSPFVLIYEVSIPGQILIYQILFLFYITTIWVSNYLNTAVQSVLGKTSRGSDFAKALSALTGLVMMLPLAIVVFLSDSIVPLVAHTSFAVFPFTWSADLVTWVVVNFNGINLTESTILAYESALTFIPLVNISLMTSFFIGMIIIGIFTSDRVFSISPGIQSERVITVGGENFILRGVRKLLPEPTNILVVTAMKDFGRKVRNTANLIGGVFIAIIFPLLINLTGIPANYLLFLAMWVSATMLALTSGLTFGGLGFLESKDQLWMMKCAPNGVDKFIKSRTIESIIYGLPMAWIPSIIVAFMLNLTALDATLLLINNSFTIIGVVLICVGITANNPNYEDAKSKVFKDNTGFTMFIIFIVSQAASVIGAITGFRYILIILFIQTLFFMTIGFVFITIGKRRLDRPD